MRLLITGADGFVGKNLQVRLHETGSFDILPFRRASSVDELPTLLGSVDAVVHLAGVNRSKDAAEFTRGNAELTASLCAAMSATGRAVPVLFSSSAQADLDNAYGVSKRQAERSLRDYGARAKAPVCIYRLPNVFGKWSRPNYNSAVATFCHNIARGLPIQTINPNAPLTLVYIDDLVDEFIRTLRLLSEGRVPAVCRVPTEYTTTVGQLAAQIQAFSDSRQSLITERVGTGLDRALYSTFVSHLPTEAFAYTVRKYGDSRGEFVEMLKTPDAGQFSFFTAHPGITRGGHYHHSKTEKFLVIRGRARFRFRHIDTSERHELFTSGETPEIVETVPGWTHEITNVGDQEVIVMLWANEIFDRQRPDTIASEVWK
jgi:UDP-2-acetamido-2,6-beta-L-arabino-hexul-4-ose reductase